MAVRQFIPTDSSHLEEKFINYVMLDGKKSVARKIMKEAYAIIAAKTSQDPKEIFKNAISKVKPKMEVRAKRIGGAVYQVPREVPPNRQVALAFRWIVGAARGKKGTTMAKKLANELMEAAKEQGAAFKKREDTHKMAAANKAFAHLARY